MKTNIPQTEIYQILHANLSPEIIVSLLNEAEEKFLSIPKHGNSKRIYPFWKICQICQKPYPTNTKEQAVRRKTCSKQCMNILIGQRNKGRRKSLEKSKKTEITCPVCGKLIVKPDCWLKRTNQPTCSSQCNGILRGMEWKKHAYKGRANWKRESEIALKNRMTGNGNPAWKGGVTYFKKHGNYIGVKYVRCPAEFMAMARKDGYVMEHRLIMARLLNRCLRRTEVVHHIDHDPTNNRIENLMLFENNQTHKQYESHERL